jgi:hypothetical protein
LVWSDQKIAELSREFVTVADEVYLLYPEDPGNLARVANRPEHLFFKKFGEAMPKGDWHHPGTKQGIYMIGPDGEYLEGRFAAGSEPADIRARLERALERWQVLQKQKRYANQPVPRVASTVPPGVADARHLLVVYSRDLPRGAGDRSGARFDPARHQDGGFLGYLAWAWNENWLPLASLDGLVAAGKEWQPVPAELVATLARQALVDNVRGQANAWSAAAVRRAELRVRQTAVRGGRATFAYAGEFELVDGARSYRGTWRGEASYDRQQRRFVAFDLAATGARTGGQQFNRREQDPGPAPLGIAIGLHQPPAERR